MRYGEEEIKRVVSEPHQSQKHQYAIFTSNLSSRKSRSKGVTPEIEKTAGGLSTAERAEQSRPATRTLKPRDGETGIEKT